MRERGAYETYTDYFVRLFEHKREYGLTCRDIADLLNAESGNSFDESAYRKEYAAFSRGRQYEREKLSLSVANRILSISDLHVPFQLPVETFESYSGRIDTLVVNGDLFDMFSCSKFVKRYHVDFMGELVVGRQYMIDLIEMLDPKDVYVVNGNHDLRLGNYIASKLDNSCMELLPSSAIDYILEDGFTHYNKETFSKTHYEPLTKVFPDIRFHYDGKWYVKVGKTLFVHPSTYSSPMMKTTEKALDWAFRNLSGFDSIVCAHTHKIGSCKQGNISMYEQGCCCKTEKMTYTDGHLTYPQQKGCMIVCQDVSGGLLFEQSGVKTL